MVKLMFAYAEKIEENNEKLEDLEANGRCDRFTAFLLISLIYFFYSTSCFIPESYELEIEKIFSLLPHQFYYLISTYNLPNALLPLVNGLLTDRVFGMRVGCYIQAVMCLAGQTIITVGGFTNSFLTILFGRLIYAIGAETLGQLMNCYIVLWFRRKEINTAFGFVQMVSSAATALSLATAPKWITFVKKHVPPSQEFGVSTVPLLVLMITNIVCVFLLGSISNQVKQGQKQRGSVTFKRTISFPLVYWLIVAELALCNTSAFIFITTSQRILTSIYNVQEEKANELSVLYNVLGSMISPLTGWLVDKTGTHHLMNFLGLILGIMSHIIMAVTTMNPYIPVILFAIYNAALNTSMWAQVSLVCEEYQLVTAYGITESVMNLVIFISSILVEYVLEYQQPSATIILFMVYTSVGLLCATSLWIIDCKRKK